MKLAFSTIGCPDFDWPDIYSMAKDFGFRGIEVRGLGEEIFAVKAKPFLKENIEETTRQLEKLHLEIPCLSSGCALRFADRIEETIGEIRQYIDLAARLGTPYIRVLGDLTAAPVDEVDDEAVLLSLIHISKKKKESER